MLRIVVLVLVLLNSAYFAWSQGWLLGLGYGPSQQREPQRMGQQIRPEALRLLAPQAPHKDETAPSGTARPSECLQAILVDDAQGLALRTALADWPAGSWVLQEAAGGQSPILRLPAVDENLRPRLEALRPVLGGQSLMPCP